MSTESLNKEVETYHNSLCKKFSGVLIASIFIINLNSVAQITSKKCLKIFHYCHKFFILKSTNESTLPNAWSYTIFSRAFRWLFNNAVSIQNILHQLIG
jgi:hypothetical protein